MEHKRRILATPGTKKPMDLVNKKNPKPSHFSGAGKPNYNHPPPPPLQDPTTTTTTTTIQNISHRFSKLYTNHKKLVTKHSKSHPNPQPDPHFNPTRSPVVNTSCTTLTKSSSQHERGKTNNFIVSKKFITKKDETIPISKIQSFEEFDVKKASQLMSKSLESDHQLLVKRFQQGRSSLSSHNHHPAPVTDVGRRRSFCSSQIELADFLSCNGVKVVAVDMPPFMQIHAVGCARKTHDSLEKFTSKNLASTLKKEFDGVYGPAWHCIVGTSFGSFVTHSVGGFMYFSMDHKIYILLFKTTVQKADG